MKIACWNTEWRTARSHDAELIRSRLVADEVEVICGPEAYEDFLPDMWHGIFSQPDYGYPLVEGRRKVALWSRNPWTEVDELGSADLPSGRFVRGVTETSLGPVDVIGICVPWSAAHVSTGRRDRTRWQDHLAYLKALQGLLKEPPERPTFLIGDLNQNIPRRRAPLEAYEALQMAMGGFTVWTAGEVPGLESPLVCHVAGSEHFGIDSVVGHSRFIDGRTVSDHDGFVADVSLR